jgi:hypothetical protein
MEADQSEQNVRNKKKVLKNKANESALIKEWHEN